MAENNYREAVSVHPMMLFNSDNRWVVGHVRLHSDNIPNALQELYDNLKSEVKFCYRPYVNEDISHLFVASYWDNSLKTLTPITLQNFDQSLPHYIVFHAPDPDQALIRKIVEKYC